MKTRALTLFCALLPMLAFAQEPAQPTLEELKWVARPIIVFADSPADPRLRQQLAAFEAEPAELEARDVVILVDTDPAANGPLRLAFRPRDFNVIVLGKDGRVAYRKPDPVTVREVIRLIDRMPLRRQEIEDQRTRPLN
ncbi:DUF4174 domain-containing protein [Halovulum dunhuangense]|uniref:DUF4174 domain-containing protein n=1 Tax=Halovulum dunhuangense TaxID=1505036 RepID=A0A849L566_9RHOB|nr:DUF4174 domain-containing protein [Halovulum dunhuangense]NNU81324.1 DUF4174 domain-containing protein [Halovulum dunhuangense]